MATVKKGDFTIPHGLKSVIQEKSYIVAFIDVKGMGISPWSKFKKHLFKHMLMAQGSNVDLDFLMERSYEEAIAKSWEAPYRSLGLNNGYLYPTVPVKPPKEIKTDLSEAILNQASIDLIYKSRRVSNTGREIELPRLYIGKVYSLDLEKDLVTLCMGDDFRSFKISKIKAVDSFLPKTKVELVHLKLNIFSTGIGNTICKWEEIRGERSELLAQPPFEDSNNAIPEPKQILISSPQPLVKVRQEVESSKRLIDTLKAEHRLLNLYDELITLVHKRERTTLRLKGFQLLENTTYAQLFGEDGISAEVDLVNLEIYTNKENQEKITFYPN